VARVALSFSGAQSKDSGSTIIGYHWSFGDGATSTASGPRHTYSRPGTYTVALTVTDATGSTATSTKSVKVFAPGIAGVGVGRRSGSIERIRIRLNGPGALKIGSHSVRIPRPETYVYPLKLNRPQVSALRQHHAIHVRLVLYFTPAVGARVRSTPSLKIKP
jgi:hypothetical protein